MSPAASRPAAAFALATVISVVVMVVACAGPSSDLDPRYIAVHNAFASVGLSQIGPIHQGSLAEGAEARVSFDLTPQCVTMMAIGSEGVRDLDATLLDPTGRPMAHDTTREAQAVLRACLETAGTYTLLVKMVQGSGSFVSATWAGGLGGSGLVATAASGNPSVAQAPGTCESPLPLAAGTVSGNTAHGESENDGTCSKTASKEIVYRLEVHERQRAGIEVHADFDTVLYVRKEDCAEAAAEIACNDDVGNDQTRSRVDLVLEPGTYFVFVDGFNGDSGTYRLTTTLADVPSLADICRRARPVPLGSTTGGTTGPSFDNVQATCGDGAKGFDVPFKMDLPARSRVRLSATSTEFPPVVHVRRSCTDAASEVGCSDASPTPNEASYAALLDPGAYTVWVDSKDPERRGAFTLRAETAPEAGSGAAGDSCGDAQPLQSTDRQVSGDTFFARDDVGGKCGGAGAADVFYRVDLQRRSRVSAWFGKEEGRHVFILSRACADRSAEISCGPRVDEVLAPGTYFLSVDGLAPDAFGRFQFEWRVRDIGGQETACRSPSTLLDGQPVTSTTAGGGDHFTTSCAGREEQQGSPDKVYKFVLTQRARVRLALTTPAWDGVLALRRSCVDVGTSPRASEIACNGRFEDTHHARIEQLLDPGTYFVVVDGRATASGGGFTLEYRVLR